jgi:NAD(P)-dependent dehydrogenase (short-subunit alcohol dehydrogenase family)
MAPCYHRFPAGILVAHTNGEEQMAAEASGRRAIFITGAASGMGRETARLFAEKGWFVGAYDVDEEGLASLERELGAERCVARRLDVTNKADYDAAVGEFATRSGGRLDLLFNNAGVGEGGWFEDVPYEAALRVVEVNLIGVLNGIYAALDLLKATANSLCFTTSSSSATYGMPRIAVYSATKHAVKGLTEALSLEFARHGVRVADVLPGMIDTPILTRTPNRSGDVPAGLRPQDFAPKQGPFRLMPARAVAECVWQAYHSDRLHWYVPEEIGEIDRAKAASAEAVREQFRALTGGAAARPAPAPELVESP